MKQSLKRNYFFVLFSLVSLLLYSCAEEKEFVNNRNLNEINLKRQPFKEVLKSPIFNTAFQKVVNRKINFTQYELARTAFEDAHDFTIVEDYPVNILNYNNYTTYSLLIESDGEEKIGFENLLIRVDSLNRTVATIVNYKTSQEDFYSLPSSFFQTVEKDVKPLIENDTIVQPEDLDKVTTQHCLSYLIPMCTIHGGNIDYDHVFINPYECVVSYYDLQEICFTTTVFGGDGGATPTGNSPTGANPGGGSSNNNNGLGAAGGSIPNVPVVPCNGCIEEDDALPADPCKKVKKQLSKFPILRQKLIDLVATTSQNIENGIFIDATATSTTSNPVQNIPNGSATQLDININPPSAYVVFAHSHNSPASSTYSIFSFSDISAFSDLGTNGHLSSDFVAFLVTSDGTKYAFTIEDQASLTDFFYDPLANPEIRYDSIKAKKYMNIADKYYLSKNPLIKENSQNTNNDLIYFLRFLDEANLNATILEANDDFSSFKKINLSNNQELQKINCK